MIKLKLYQRELFYACLSIIPALLFFVLFVYYPLFKTLIYSFTDWNGYSSHYNWVGFRNFATVFTESENGKVFLNTIYFAFFSVLFGTIIQLTLALIGHMKLKGTKVAITFIYIPAVISPIIVALTWSSLMQYTGVINEVLKSIGAPDLVTDWLGSAAIVKNSLILINLWQYTGMGMVIFLSGLGSIPQEVNEAAMLDGATHFRKFRLITLPLLMPFVTMNLFIGITGALRIFELPFIMTNGGPINASKTIVMSIYENAFQYQRFGVASSIGILFFLFIAFITLIQLRVTSSKETEY